jgi:hypothetical protein
MWHMLSEVQHVSVPEAQPPQFTCSPQLLVTMPHLPAGQVVVIKSRLQHWPVRRSHVSPGVYPQ